MQPFDHDRQAQEAVTRDVVTAFMQFWAAQDVTETVSLLTPDVVSVVYLDPSAGGMSGRKTGRDTIAEGLYGNLATWHYLQFDWKVTSVEHNTGRAQVTFEYQHQKTGLRYAGSMRMILVVGWHDQPRGMPPR